MVREEGREKRAKTPSYGFCYHPPTVHLLYATPNGITAADLGGCCGQAGDGCARNWHLCQWGQWKPIVQSIPYLSHGQHTHKALAVPHHHLHIWPAIFDTLPYKYRAFESRRAPQNWPGIRQHRPHPRCPLVYAGRSIYSIRHAPKPIAVFLAVFIKGFNEGGQIGSFDH